MKLSERIEIFNLLFDSLQSTNSKLNKDEIVKDFEKCYPELLDDWKYILETIAGQHPIGWKFKHINIISTSPNTFDEYDIRQVIHCLENSQDKKHETTLNLEVDVGNYGEFIEPIVNRTLRLGINKSLLEKTDLTPMLAKKYEGQMLHNEVYVTEKLDGNRCIAYYDNEWHFISRNGKPMKVSFDMSIMPQDIIYDGEVLSKDLSFNKTSGLIHSHQEDKSLYYCIFDIISDLPYKDRRGLLDSLPSTENVKILPVLYKGTETVKLVELLDKIVDNGGEGIMLNFANRKYEHKRTDALLKYKKVQTIDIRVINLFEGKGKYEGMVGGLTCYIKTEDNKEIYVQVGSGLSDEQRLEWIEHPSKIIDKIVEVAYHELTQDKNNLGTNIYSLRFPRLKKVRENKKETSEW